MKLRILAKNFQLTPMLEERVREKLVKPAAKLLGDLDKKMGLPLDVELAKSTKHHKHGKIWYCEANLFIPGLAVPIRARATELSIPGAIDEVKDELEREIKKYKEKFRSTAIREARKFRKRS